MHKNIVFYFEEDKDGRFLNDFFAEYISKFPEIEMNGIEFLGNNYYGVIGNKCGFWKEHEVNKEDVYFAPSMYPLYFEHPNYMGAQRNLDITNWLIENNFITIK